jgi:hypothetical protein
MVLQQKISKSGLNVTVKVAVAVLLINQEENFGLTQSG